MGHTVLSCPLLDIEQLDNPLPTGTFDGIVLTSAMALEALEKTNSFDRRTVSVITTGSSTRDAAKLAGFDNVVSANGGALDVIDLLKTKFGTSSRLLYPCAEQTAHDLSKLLEEHNLSCVPWPVYRSVELEKFPIEVDELLSAGKIDVALLYSPKTAKAFSNCWNATKGQYKAPRILALSQQVKSKLPLPLQKQCRSANLPNEDSLFELL